MSQYITNKMALAGSFEDNYQWKNGKCYNVATGVPYSGDQKDSNCYAAHGPAPSSGGFSAVLEYGKSMLMPAQQTYSGQPGQPSSSFTSSGLLLPAVAVVGGVALLLILKKKK